MTETSNVQPTQTGLKQCAIMGSQFLKGILSKMSETPPRNNTFLTEQMPFEMSSIKQFGIIHAP